MENYITQMFGVAAPEALIEYMERNWKTINYDSTIHTLLGKFQDSVKGHKKHSATRKKYEHIKEAWERFNSKPRGEIVGGHFDNCTGADCCKCNYFLFDYPRNLIGTIIHSYYTTRCITKMIKNYNFGNVISHFEKNWRRMDLQKIMKWMLKQILKDIGGYTYAFLQLKYDRYFSDLDNIEFSHIRYSCNGVFHDGLLECACYYYAMYEKPKSFIRDMLERYYREKKQQNRSK